MADPSRNRKLASTLSMVGHLDIADDLTRPSCIRYHPMDRSEHRSALADDEEERHGDEDGARVPLLWHLVRGR